MLRRHCEGVARLLPPLFEIYGFFDQEYEYRFDIEDDPDGLVRCE